MSITPKKTEKFFLNAIESMVKYRRETKKSRGDFLQMMMDAKNFEDNENTFTLDEIAANSFSFFLAGYETGSTVMAFCLFELAQNQTIQDKVREEIREVFRKHKDLTYESLGELQYLECVINGIDVHFSF